MVIVIDNMELIVNTKDRKKEKAFFKFSTSTDGRIFKLNIDLPLERAEEFLEELKLTDANPFIQLVLKNSSKRQTTLTEE